jgi:hypothetical protein
MRRLNNWLPQTLGLLASAFVAILVTAPHALTWPRLLATSAFIVILTSAVCAVTMLLTYVALPKPTPGPTIARTSATAACLGPLIIFLREPSIWAPIVAAFLVWTILPANVTPKAQWKKFTGAFCAAVLLQIGAASALGRESIVSALALGLGTAPILWRIRQERTLRGPFKPRLTIMIAALFAIIALTHYLPGGGNSNESTPSAGNKSNTPSRGLTRGGKYRGVILTPEEAQHTILVVPLALMSHDPFVLHKDPIGIPFYGVYWFFQSPDKAPDEDAYRVKGSPDNVSFHSADNSGLRMEAHQNLGRLIDLGVCSRIDIAVRNADVPDSTDVFVGSLALELILVNTALPGRASQSLGRIPITSKPPSAETLSFKIPPAPAIQQFDELTIRFRRSGFRSIRSARVAIDRFFLVPR